MAKLYPQSLKVFWLILALSPLFFMTNMINAQTLPKPDHIIVLIEENQPNSLIIGAPSVCPYINQLAADSDAAVFTKFFAIEHPSQPNYLDLFSGSNQGVLDDNLPANYPFISPNMAWELLHKGYSFITYSQDLPSVGSDVQNSTTGSYVRKHNPVTNWVGTGPNQVPDTCNQPYEGYFPTDYSTLPTVCYVVPNEDSDMHNGSYPSTCTAGDFWMHEHLDSLLRWVRNNNALFIYTFDEDDGFNNNNIPTLFYGPMVKGGTYSVNDSLYNILRTIEDMYDLGEHAGAAADYTPITGIWRSSYTAGVNTIVLDAPHLKLYPDPASSILTIDASGLGDAAGEMTLTDLAGRLISRFAIPVSQKLQINISDYEAGLYLYHFIQDNGNIQSGKFVVSHQ